MHLRVATRMVKSDQAGEQGRRFIDRFRLFIQQRGYSHTTEKAYVDWAKRFLKHFKFQKESDIRLVHLERYLTYLAQERQHSPNSQKVVLSALVLLYRDFMGLSTKGLNFSQASPRAKVPVVLSPSESQKLFTQLSGSFRLMAKLMYGCGLRVSEAARLRVGHVDFDTQCIFVSQGKGGKDRYLPMPRSLVAALQTQLNSVEQWHQDDVEDGFGYVSTALNLSMSSQHLSRKIQDQFLFPTSERVFDSRVNTFCRWFISEQKIRRHIKNAAAKAGIRKTVTCHTLRHSYATALLKEGVDIRSVQTLLGHDSVRTTEIYTHVINQDLNEIKSPVDALAF